ncbi:alanine and glycine-rich protein-like [Oryza brachyantha]|uniref:alanine and glycine-rich protein-like n=1 Tax=Oryza brachyantha TaxID=4533 RepID=UPI001ADC9C21|nr:alanine and glycine-rich protein-like [Oryza brachyantha]
MDKKQYGSKGGGGNARRSATAGVSGKLRHKGKLQGGGGGGGSNNRRTRREIKVVYISNPMRVTTSEEGFRALVQELTGRHAADPSKYRGGGGGGASGADAGAASGSGGGGGSPCAEMLLQDAAAMAPSPGASTVESSTSTDHGDASAAGGQAQAAAWGEDDENSFAPELIDNRYSVCFSPPTFLYGSHSYVDDDYGV